jgi:hypothetical protein
MIANVFADLFMPVAGDVLLQSLSWRRQDKIVRSVTLLLNLPGIIIKGQRDTRKVARILLLMGCPIMARMQLRMTVLA